MKKKESILNNRYLNLRKQYEKEDQKFKDINKNMTTDYKRINRQFKELQRKFKHFEKSRATLSPQPSVHSLEPTDEPRAEVSETHSHIS